MTLPIVRVKDSIATKLLRIVFSYYFLLTLLVTLVHIFSEYYYTKQSVESELKSLQRVFEPGLTAALWDIDEEQTQSMLHGIIEIPSIIGVKVKDDAGKVYQIGTIKDDLGDVITVDSQGGHIQSSGFGGIFSHQFSLNSQQELEEMLLGKVTIYSSSQVVFQKVRVGLVFLVINAIIKTLAIWGLFLYVFRFLLSRPLANLTVTIQNLDLDSLEGVHISTQKKGRNELRILEDAFNLMIEKLISARKKLHDYAKELKNKSHKLTETLLQLQEKHSQLQETQTHLIQAEKMASLGILVTGVAHEINNPTNFVNIYAQNLQTELQEFKTFIFSLISEDGGDREIMDVFNSKFKKFFETSRALLDGTGRIKNIVLDLRTFSRMDQGQYKKESVLGGVEATIKLVEPQYRQQVKILRDFQADPPVSCSLAQLNQVFMNLIVNACQAILEKQKGTHNPDLGILKISSFIIETTTPISYFVLSFQDDGCGMSSDIQQKMFDPFFTTKGTEEGTGLGLAITYKIIQEHRGKLEVTSILGSGTTLLLKLPLSDYSNETDSSS